MRAERLFSIFACDEVAHPQGQQALAETLQEQGHITGTKVRTFRKELIGVRESAEHRFRVQEALQLDAVSPYPSAHDATRPALTTTIRRRAYLLDGAARHLEPVADAADEGPSASEATATT